MRDRADELRAEFDATFAAPSASAETTSVDVLLVRAGGVPYVIVRADVSGLYADLVVVSVPTRAPELLGLAAIHNVVVPVYAIERLVGSARSPAAPRWLVAIRTLALAFEAFDGYRRVASLPVAPASGHLRGVVEVDGELRPILDIESVLTTISRRTAAAKER